MKYYWIDMVVIVAFLSALLVGASWLYRQSLVTSALACVEEGAYLYKDNKAARMAYYDKCLQK